MSRRSSISRAKRVRIFDAAGGKCYLCGLPIQQGETWEVEHPIALGIGGSDKESDLRPAHADCHKLKTAEDKKLIAKSVRVRADHIGAKLPPKQKIANRGFPTRDKPRMEKPPALPRRDPFTHQVIEDSR